MLRKLSLPIIILCSILLTGCIKSHNEIDTASYRILKMRYATLLTMHQGVGYVHVEMKNPWDSLAPPRSLVLVDAEDSLPAHLPKGAIVRVPISSAAVFSSVHCGLMKELGAMEYLGGVCDADYVYLDEVRRGLQDGSIADLGQSISPDIERIIELHPGALLVSSSDGMGPYGKMGELNIPIIDCIDYMESHPLARAEWMKFYGMLFGQRERGDSIFKAVESDYLALKAKTDKASSRPTVTTDLKTGSTWYVAGARSTTAQFIADAGATYIFKDVDARGSVPMSPEQVFDRSINADYWIFKYNRAKTMTYDELAAEYPSYKEIKAFKNRKVFGCNLSTSLFYEQTPFHPELLLRDYILMFHPELLPDEQMRYFKPLD